MRQVVDMSARVVMEEEDNGFGWLWKALDGKHAYPSKYYGRTF